MVIKISINIFFCIIGPILFAFVANAQPPVAPVRNVVDEYWGVKVNDPYRYMENLGDPEVQEWIKGQAEYCSSVLSKIPNRDVLAKRIKELDSGTPFHIFYFYRKSNGIMYYLKQKDTENVPKLYVLDTKTRKETMLIDPDRHISSDGRHCYIEFYSPSPDDKYILYGISKGGSEETVIYILDVTTGKDLNESIDRIETAYNSPNWLPDSKSFFYVRRQKLAPDAPATEGYKNTIAYIHKLGTDPEKDKPVMGVGLSSSVKLEPTDFPSVVKPINSNYVIGQIKRGDTDELMLYTTSVESIDKPDIQWKKICDFEDCVTEFAVNGDDVYLMTFKDAPRFKVVRTSLKNPDFKNAELVLPQSEAVVSSISIAKDAIYVGLLDGGINRILRIDFDLKNQPKRIEVEKDLSHHIVSATSEIDGIFLSASSWVKRDVIYSYNPKTGKFTDTQLRPKGKFDNVPGYESVEVKVKSHDGVMVPLSIIYKKGIKLDGSNPTLISGYGSYGMSRNVHFNPIDLAWLERGGVLAIAHVRGGGEYGKEWHLAGRMLNKPNTWKDFIACAEYLIEKGYTSPARLAGQGGSAGGILIGMAIAERPDLFAAAIINVGDSDMLRSETTTNGVPNIQEFGTVKTEDGFKGLYAMSPYHHIKDGVKYPAVLLTHGINDHRVEPWASAKMTARLQSATASGKPILFRVDYDAGHGIGSTKLQYQNQTADEWAFLLWQFGVKEFQP